MLRARISGIAGVIFLALVSCTSQDAEKTDQETIDSVVIDQKTNTDNLTLYSGLMDSSLSAQTFNVGVSGVLVKVDIYIQDLYNSSINLKENEIFVEIRRVYDEIPSDDIADILGTAVLDPSVFSNGYNSFKFNINVQEGEQLAIVAYNKGDAGMHIRGVGGSNNDGVDQYTSGKFWSSGSFMNGDWYPNGNSKEYEFDLAFRTYVAMP